MSRRAELRPAPLERDELDPLLLAHRAHAGLLPYTFELDHAGRTVAHVAIRTDLAYQPDHSAHHFGMRGDRGIGRGVSQQIGFDQPDKGK